MLGIAGCSICYLCYGRRASHSGLAICTQREYNGKTIYFVVSVNFYPTIYMKLRSPTYFHLYMCLTALLLADTSLNTYNIQHVLEL
jgi:hypothetical protein